MELSLLANCLLSSIELIISLCPLSIIKKSHIHVFVIFHQRLIIKKEKKIYLRFLIALTIIKKMMTKQIPLIMKIVLEKKYMLASKYLFTLQRIAE